MPRNETSRWPGRLPSNSFTTPRNWSRPQTLAATLQPTKTARKRSRSTRRRKSSTTAGASSAYSIDLRRGDQVLRRRARAASRSTRRRTAPSSAPASDPERPRLRASGPQPKRTPARERRGEQRDRDRDVRAVDVDRPDRRVRLVACGAGRRGGSRPPRRAARASAAREREAKRRPLYSARPRCAPESSGDARRRRSGLRRDGARLPHDGRRDPRARRRTTTRSFAAVFAATGVLPGAARPHDRGGARQVRLPLHRRPSAGAGCAACSSSRSRSSCSAACSPAVAAGRARAVRAAALGRGRRARADADRAR